MGLLLPELLVLLLARALVEGILPAATPSPELIVRRVLVRSILPVVVQLFDVRTPTPFGMLTLLMLVAFHNRVQSNEKVAYVHRTKRLLTIEAHRKRTSFLWSNSISYTFTQWAATFLPIAPAVLGPYAEQARGPA